MHRTTAMLFGKKAEGEWEYLIPEAALLEGIEGGTLNCKMDGYCNCMRLFLTLVLI